LKKKVVIIYPYETGENAFSGGVAKVIVSNIFAAHANSFEVHLLLPNNNKGLVEFIKNEHSYCFMHLIKFSTLSLYSDSKGFIRFINVFYNLLSFLIGTQKYFKTIKKINPDIIHFHESNLFPYYMFFRKTKKIVHLHSYRFIQLKNLFNIIIYFINKYIDYVVCPTKSILVGIHNYVNVHVEILKTPYLPLTDRQVDSNDERISKIKSIKNEDKIVFAFVGRISRIKRIDYFLKAISQFDETNQSKLYFFIIGSPNHAGDFEYKNELIKIIAERNLRNVEFIDYVNPIESALKYIDYGVILSESEAIPMIGIEFMRFNIPILGFNVPGVNDFLLNKQNGFIVSNGDISELSNQILQIVKNNNKSEMESKISEMFEEYTLSKFETEIGLLYNKML